jgi:hypothetical protein
MRLERVLALLLALSAAGCGWFGDPFAGPLGPPGAEGDQSESPDSEDEEPTHHFVPKDVDTEAPPSEEDEDNDGTPADEDCDDDDPELGSQSLDQDCDGVLTSDDCDDSDPTLLSLAQDPDCDGVPGTDDGPAPCISCSEEDMDCDGSCWYEDCDDMNPFTTVMADDADCDGFLTNDDCDDTDPNIRPGAADIGLDGIDQNCDGVDAVFLTPSQELAVDWVRTLLALDCAEVEAAGGTITDLAAPVPGDPCPQLTTSSQNSTTGPNTQSSSSALYSGGCTDSLGAAVSGSIGIDETDSYEDLSGTFIPVFETVRTWDLEALSFSRQTSSPSTALILEETSGSMHTTTSYSEDLNGVWITIDTCQWATNGATTLQSGTSGPWVEGTTSLALTGSATTVVDRTMILTRTYARSVSGTASAEGNTNTWTAQIAAVSWWNLYTEDPGRIVMEGGTNQPSTGQVTVEVTDPSSGSLLHTLELTFGGCVDHILHDEPWPLGPPNTYTPGPYGPAGCSGCAEATIDGQPAVRQCGGWEF